MATKKTTKTETKAAMLEDLTPGQDTILETVFKEYDAAIEAPRPPDIGVIRAWLTVVYGLYDLPVPERIEIVGSPFAASALAKELTGEEHAELDWCGIRDASWVAYYDTFGRLGVLTAHETTELIALREYQWCIWDSLLLDECAIVVALPQIKRDDAGQLHSSTGPAIEWTDGRREWSWHGTWVTERIICDPRSHTREEYLAIDNTEVRRALGESAGWDWITRLLGAQSIDQWTDPATDLSFDLLGTATERWLRKQSPKLQEGDQPVYVEPVHEQLRTARAARKWQATTLTAEQCERDPDLSYGVET